MLSIHTPITGGMACAGATYLQLTPLKTRQTALLDYFPCGKDLVSNEGGR